MMYKWKIVVTFITDVEMHYYSDHKSAFNAMRIALNSIIEQFGSVDAITYSIELKPHKEE